MTIRIVSLRTCFILLCLFLVQQVIAQAPSKRLLGSFILGNEAYNYEFTMEASDSYSFGISSISDTIAATANNDRGETLAAGKNIFNEFTEDIFERVFAKQMKDKYTIEDDSTKKAATEVFFKIKAKLDFIDDEPTTAYFILKRDHIFSLLRYSGSNPQKRGRRARYAKKISVIQKPIPYQYFREIRL
jgi:hypothetical protein